ncbi:hypothetical protein [Streptomyces himastatinicus]|uniref:hypothetical protein n=1 Tax=Streptomyces himastatinicus TaxID=998084 RepID=UPI0001B5194A|nr:hypothetical protein [Streptomyces himastatinicus]
MSDYGKYQDKIRTVGAGRRPECVGAEPHEDDEGTRFFGVPAWVICLVACAAMPVALLSYTYASR